MPRAIPEQTRRCGDDDNEIRLSEFKTNWMMKSRLRVAAALALSDPEIVDEFFQATNTSEPDSRSHKTKARSIARCSSCFSSRKRKGANSRGPSGSDRHGMQYPGRNLRHDRKWLGEEEIGAASTKPHSSMTDGCRRENGHDVHADTSEEISSGGCVEAGTTPLRLRWNAANSAAGSGFENSQPCP